MARGHLKRKRSREEEVREVRLSEDTKDLINAELSLSNFYVGRFVRETMLMTEPSTKARSVE